MADISMQMFSERKAREILYVRPPISLDDADNSACRLLFLRRITCFLLFTFK